MVGGTGRWSTGQGSRPVGLGSRLAAGLEERGGGRRRCEGVGEDLGFLVGSG
jgi:hypothetical protein